MAWIRQPQEQEGDHWFNGQPYLTRRVSDEIPEQEIQAIVADLFQFVEQEKGVDYLQVYVNDRTGIKVWIIDQLTKEQVESGEFLPEYNHFTVLFPEEY